MRIEKIGTSTLYLGDCREVMLELPQVDVAVVDPPYGETSLRWDRRVDGWLGVLPTRNLWCFGSFRSFRVVEFEGWSFAQELIWEKHNGSSFSTDRFRRVHEIVAQFYRGDWKSLYHEPVYTMDAQAKTVRRKQRPAHWGEVGESFYKSEDGGPRLMRSVIYCRSSHGEAIHPTQKPEGIVEPLVRYSCPEGGTVLDPMMGSGTTGIVCQGLNRKFIGIEVDEGYFDAACRRLEQNLRQGRLPL